MTTPSSSPRILLLADRRVSAVGGGVRIQRYRLARLARPAGPAGAAPQLVSSKSL